MSRTPDQQPAMDQELDAWDQETLALLGPDGLSLGAFPLESLSAERMFWNGVTALAVTATTIAVGIKLAKEVLGR